jgi:hypothetical protein
MNGTTESNCIDESANPKNPPSAYTEASDHTHAWYQLFAAAGKNVSFEIVPESPPGSLP